jgi:uncharacterized pyridoxamine 5'-phosphate oxidase family protein
MTPEEIKKKIYEFIKNKHLTVIATIDNDTNKPEAAVIAFSEQEDLKLIIGTSNLSRKYKNIQKNPHVSFVIGWDGREGTVQYEGIAQEIDHIQKEKYGTMMGNKNQNAKKFIERPD